MAIFIELSMHLLSNELELEFLPYIIQHLVFKIYMSAITSTH